MGRGVGLLLVCAGCSLGTEGLGDVASDGSATAVGGFGGSPTGLAFGAGGSESAAPACDGAETCVPAPGSAIYVVLAAASTSCPDGWRRAGERAADATPWGCTACTCGAPTGTCASGTVTAFDHGNCTGTTHPFASPADGACLVMPGGPSGSDAFGVSPAVASQGTCASSVGSPLPIPTRTVCVLAKPAVTCAGGSCVQAPVDGQVCVVMDHPACPAGWSSAAELYPVDGDDRACSCTCAPVTGTCTGAGASAFGDTACGGAAAGSVLADGSCLDPSGVNDIGSIRVEAGTWSTDASCLPDASVSGAIRYGAGLKLCCAP